MPQLSGEALARGGAAVEPLKAALQAAGARLSLPNVAHPVRAFASALPGLLVTLFNLLAQ